MLTAWRSCSSSAAVAWQVELTAFLLPLAKKRGLVVSAGSNIGPAYRDFRVPDGSFFDARPPGLHVINAVLVIEVLSPDDETWEVRLLRRSRRAGDPGRPPAGALGPVLRPAGRRCRGPRSRVLDVAMDDVVAAIDWPAWFTRGQNVPMPRDELRIVWGDAAR